MGKPYGMAEYDGYSFVSVPKTRKPLSKEEEETIGVELRENIRNILKSSPIKKEPLHKKADKQRKIG